ncbi:FAD:protein FMN transferase (plasmid) [Coraliomargarita sp. W4R53]
MTGERSHWQFEAIGTRWDIETDTALASCHRERVSALIEQFDFTWSRFRADSLVSALARGQRSIPLPLDASQMFEAYSALSDATNGAINPLIGEALASRGYDESYSFVDRGVQSTPNAWRSILNWHTEQLTLTEPATIDIGAVGKGHLVDLVSDALADVTGSLVVDASGDISVRGGSQRIALEHPYDSARAIGVWEVSDAALCASATNRRAWGENLHHVLDARTGEPVDTVAATWAVAARALSADGIATALFFEGGPQIAHEWDVQWVRMFTDGRVQWSTACDAELFYGR